ncbi:MAG TPA: YggT family protein [Actinomycetota bacterium]|nr:YggT family protein [Actinomycetota bacterium]
MELGLRFELLNAITLFCVIYGNLMFVRIILAWLPVSPPPWLRPAFSFIYDATEPFLRLFRGLLPAIPLGGASLDISPILAFIVIGRILPALAASALR